MATKKRRKNAPRAEQTLVEPGGDAAPVAIKRALDAREVDAARNEALLVTTAESSRRRIETYVDALERVIAAARGVFHESIGKDFDTLIAGSNTEVLIRLARQEICHAVEWAKGIYQTLGHRDACAVPGETLGDATARILLERGASTYLVDAALNPEANHSDGATRKRFDRMKNRQRARLAQLIASIEQKQASPRSFERAIARSESMQARLATYRAAHDLLLYDRKRPKKKRHTRGG